MFLGQYFEIFDWFIILQKTMEWLLGLSLVENWAINFNLNKNIYVVFAIKYFGKTNLYKQKPYTCLLGLILGGAIKPELILWAYI